MSDFSETQKQAYEAYVKQVTPTHSLPVQAGRAFLVGGAICVLGQFIMDVLVRRGISQDVAGGVCSLILIFLSVVFTGLGLYAKLVKWGGAGALVPITGFANSVSSCAIEYQVEGQVFGVGCKIFNIAGPVILYGLFSSWLLGIFYYVLKLI